MESLSLRDLQFEIATLTSCSSDYITSTGFKWKQLDIPTAIPTTYSA